MRIPARQAFQEELLELVRTLEGGILELEKHADAERIGNVFRCAHNIKSAAAMLGLEQASSTAHELENILEEVRAGHRVIDAEIITHLLNRLDMLTVLLAEPAETTLHESQPPVQPALPPKSRRLCVSLHLDADALLRALDPLTLLDAAAQFGRISKSSTDESRLPPLESLDPEQLYLGFDLVLETAATAEDLRSVFLFAEGAGQITVYEVQEPPPAQSLIEEARELLEDRSLQTLVVSVSRVDALIELAAELSVATAQLEQLSDSPKSAAETRMHAACTSVRQLASRIQEASMAIRLVPVAPTFALLRRYVRDQAMRMGKAVEVSQHGEHLEIDKTIAERLFNPLKHLVRNALDHGIEAPEERARKGKPLRGQLVLEARQEHGRVVLDVRDDGRGLDLLRIREVAVARRLISADAEISEADAYSLIFKPGFSTASRIGTLSGRGVGLDVVHRDIVDLGGDLRVRSQAGRGVTFTLSVPLTLAIIEGLVLRCAEEYVVVPLEFVRNIFRPRAMHIAHLPGGAEVLRLADAVLPLVRLSTVLGFPTAFGSAVPLVVILSTSSGLLGLYVDEVVSQESVLLKGFHRSLCMGEGILAATVLASGRIALVLDISAIFSHNLQRLATEAELCPPSHSAFSVQE